MGAEIRAVMVKITNPNPQFHLQTLNHTTHFKTPQEHEEEASETTKMGSKESREESDGKGAEEEGNRTQTKGMGTKLKPRSTLFGYLSLKTESGFGL